MAEHATQTTAQQNPQNAVGTHETSAAAARQDLRPDNALYELQRILGNQAMQRSLQRKCASCQHDSDEELPAAMQTKLAINQPGDAFEQEADRVADAVMSGGSAPATVQRTCACGGTCDDCQRKAEVLQRASAGSDADPAAGTAPSIVHEVLGSPGEPLDRATRSFMEARLGADLGGVRVHTGSRAAESAHAINALAYTVGRDVVLGSEPFGTSNQARQRLLAHELTHVIQQGAAERRARGGEATSVAGDRASGIAINRFTSPGVQRSARLTVQEWTAEKFQMPVPQNSADGGSIKIQDPPDKAQVLISGLVQVDGDDPTDRCSIFDLGTMQTAWIAWTIMYYRGQNPGDGTVTVRHKCPVPIRDPSDSSSEWYDVNNVRRPAACGDSAGVFHKDDPGHEIPKTTINDAAPGNPVNFLRGYTRGLHLVTYLTANDADGNFLPHPLKFVYWNSLQDFNFTPDFNNPQNMWAFQGQVKVNIGSKGNGETADAPYMPDLSATFNDNFNDSSNWEVTKKA